MYSPLTTAGLAADASPAGGPPRPFPLRFQRRQMVFHGHQHDVRILKAQVAFVVGGIKRALTFGVGVERVVSVRMLVGGYRACLLYTSDAADE